MIINGFEISGDGRTVWVNGPDGCNVARFSARAGIDVHKRTEDQMRDSTVCIDCSPEPDWDRFVAAVEQAHGIRVPSRYKPKGAK